jgi:hypothetical protein
MSEPVHPARIWFAEAFNVLYAAGEIDRRPGSDEERFAIWRERERLELTLWPGAQLKLSYGLKANIKDGDWWAYVLDKDGAFLTSIRHYDPAEIVDLLSGSFVYIAPDAWWEARGLVRPEPDRLPTRDEGRAASYRIWPNGLPHLTQNWLRGLPQWQLSVLCCRLCGSGSSSRYLRAVAEWERRYPPPEWQRLTPRT